MAEQPKPDPSARHASDVDAVADAVESAVTQGAARSPTLLHSVSASLITAALTVVGTGLGGSKAADELKSSIADLKAQILAQGASLTAIQAALQSDHAVDAAQHHEDRIRALEGQIADLQKGAWERTKRLDAVEKALERK